MTHYTITGTTGDDLNLNGTEGDDVIGGLEGNDTIHGLGGNDEIEGHSGNDALHGDEGDDVLIVSAGTDTVDGGAGTDRLVIDAYEQPGAVSFAAPTAGAEGLSGSASWGGGSVTYQRIENITVRSSAGSYGDNVTTGAGDDAFVHYGINNALYLMDFVDLGAGTKDAIVADFTAVTSFAVTTHQLSAPDHMYLAVGGNGKLDYRNAERLFLVGGALGDTVTGLSGDDILSGAGGNDILAGGTGADTLDGGEGSDTLRGQAGDDTLVTNAGNDTVEGGAGVDTLVVEYGDSTQSVINNPAPYEDGANGGFQGAYYDYTDGRRVSYTGIERFVITTGSGDDTITTVSGDDIVVAGAGNDLVDVGTGTDFASGGAGEDRISADLSEATVAIRWNLQTNTFIGHQDSFTNFEYFGTVTTGTGNDVIVTGAIFKGETIWTSAGDDSVTVVRGVDYANLGAGADTLVVDYGAATASVISNPAPYEDAINGGFQGNYYDYTDGSQVFYTGAERFIVTTGSGDDTITTASGNDVVKTGAGADVVNVGTGTDDADGGAGVDGISADLSEATKAILWDLQANSFSGDQDSFANFEYFGKITTGTGDDVIVTGTMFKGETISTGKGADTVTVVRGTDYVNLGTGTDTLIVDYSAATNSVISNPAPYEDGTNGGFQGNYYDYTDGSQVFFTGAERFVVTTGSGNDTITTASGNDVVETGAGDDIVNVGTGTDDADGGAGTDGITADLSEATKAILWDLQANSFSGDQDSFANFEYFGTVVTGSGNDVIVTGSLVRNETIRTGAGDDRITVVRGNDTVHAGSGTDTLVVDYSASTNQVTNNPAPQEDGVNGGFQGNYFDYSDGSQVNYTGIERFEITTGSGNDIITGAAGDDVLTLGAGNDTGNGGGGNDLIDGGRGSDVLRGEDGDDILRTVKTTGLTDHDTAHGGAGDTDTLVADFSQSASGLISHGIPFTSNGDGGHDGQYSNQVDQTVGFTGIERFEITGTQFSDTIVTGSGADILRGGGGNDQLTAGAGNDELDGGTGSDTMIGGQGDDIYFVDSMGDGVSEASGEGTDEVRTALGSRNDYTQLYVLAANVEKLTGTSATGQGVRGNSLDNIIAMGAGGDFVALDDGGDDTVSGGGGDDFFFYGAQLTAADKTDGGAGTDTVGLLGTYSLTFAADSLTGVERLALFSGAQDGQANPSNSYNITTHDGNVAAGGNLLVTAAPLRAGETLVFNGAAETDGSFNVQGGAGADIIAGGAGNDFFRGGGGDDQLYGLGGRDTLIGGGGADTLRGGGGADWFVFEQTSDSTASATDRIVDFQKALDRIDLTRIDAIAGTPENEAFSFIGSEQFGEVAGQLRIYKQNGSWFAEGDTDGDGKGDLLIEIRVVNDLPLTGSEFML